MSVSDRVHECPAGARLIVDEIGILPLDVVPALKRRIPTGALSYCGEKSWVGRPVMVRVSAQGLRCSAVHAGPRSRSNGLLD